MNWGSDSDDDVGNFTLEALEAAYKRNVNDEDSEGEIQIESDIEVENGYPVFKNHKEHVMVVYYDVEFIEGKKKRILFLGEDHAVPSAEDVGQDAIKLRLPQRTEIKKEGVTANTVKYINKLNDVLHNQNRCLDVYIESSRYIIDKSDSLSTNRGFLVISPIQQLNTTKHVGQGIDKCWWESDNFSINCI